MRMTRGEVVKSPSLPNASAFPKRSMRCEIARQGPVWCGVVLFVDVLSAGDPVLLPVVRV